MYQVSGPPLRRSAALALVIYAMVSIAGSVLLHETACPDDPAPHCVLCACLSSLSLAADPPAPLHADRTDVGTIFPAGDPCEGARAASPCIDRAPPALLS